MSLVRTSLLNGIAVAVKLGTTLALNKILALHVGPAGYAVIGQFQNAIAIILAVASGSLNTGITKYTAEYQGDIDRQHAVWRTAAMTSLAGGGACAVILILWRRPIAAWALADEKLSSVMVWLAGALLLLLVNSLLLSILSGRKEVRAYVLANIAGSIVTAMTATLLVLQLGLYGALVALAIGQAIACIFTLWLFVQVCPTPWRTFLGLPSYESLWRLAAFSLMGLTSAILTPTSQVLIRDGIADSLGWHSAGLWQAQWRISETHLMLLTTTLSLYFLPRFSEIRNAGEMRNEVAKGFRFVVPVVFASAASIYSLRHWLVPTLLSDAFLPLVDVLGWQVVGDCFKICSWVLAFTLLSRAQTTIFLAMEIIFSVVLVACVISGANLDGLRGAAIGYTVTYALYGTVMLFFFRRMLHNHFPAPQ